MANFFSKLFGFKEDAPSQRNELQHTPDESQKKSGRREPPKELDWSRAEQVPLPSSPPTWEVDGRNEFQNDYRDPVIGPVFRASFSGKHAAVVKLATGLTAEQRKGKVGVEIAKAFRKLIVQRNKNSQLAAAAKLSLEMFATIPDDVEDVDRRRYNRVLGQLDKDGKKHEFTPVEVSDQPAQPLFAITEALGWVLAGERKLKDDERPHQEFEIASVDSQGTWWLDSRGSSAGLPEVKCVIRRTDRQGNPVGEKALGHDAYRFGMGVAGSSIGIMDSNGGLHVYGPNLELVKEINLRDDLRVTEHFRTIDTNYWGDFKSQVRAIDVSPEGDRYLFTLADEAWCCTLDGRIVWGVAMPLKEGWKRVVARTERASAGRDVEEALRLLGLALPVSPAQIKEKYRSLALVYHPDRNSGDPQAEEKMKALNNAFEVLTGVDPNTLVFEESDKTFFARTKADHVIEAGPFRIEINIGGGTPQDWIYAASFSAKDGGAYLATYSGKVILLSKEGDSKIVYHIGTCPSDIVDVGRYTYFLTATRLYVIEDGTKLSAYLDVFHQGRLLVTSNGFGLITSKTLQWFTQAGVCVGKTEARDPIRAVHAVAGKTIVQTRQHQVEVQGLEL